MKKIYISGRPLAAALAVALCAGASAGAPANVPDGLDDASAVALAHASGAGYSAPDAAGRARYIVILDEAPLASYAGEQPGLAAVPRRSTALAAGRPDVKSAEAVAYVDHLRAVQQTFAADAAAKLGRDLPVAAQFQHAVNAVALDLTPAEAARLRERADVKFVNRERIRKLDTFGTPTLIGATQVWNGAATPGGIASKGEGIVIGVIDSGINWASNSYKATDGAGYTHVNPLGAGNYLGQCRAGRADAGHCNDKLIGIYNLDSATASGQDINGHGSHTSSTSGGNSVTGAPFAGGTFNVSGIAPHANIIAYMACGSCSDTALTGAVNQAVADGIVDVINYSIGGPTPSPWSDSTDLAFLGALNAGIFIAKSAGNDGPGAGSAATSAAPWETTVGATTPSRVAAFQFSLTAPLGAPNTVNLAAKPGAAPAPTQAYNNLPLIESPNFADGSNDGCAAYPSNYFRRGQVPGGAQGIAVLHLNQNASNCGSGARRTAAANAGALAVIYVDPLFINLGATGASYSVLMSDWNAIKATAGIDVTPNGNATASLGFPIADGPRPADNITSFSSRGPVPYAVLKPDLSAPGDAILAAKSPTVASGYNAGNLAATSQIYALDSGTSMASPHVAGAAALVRAINRSWTPMEVRSALMTTAAPVLDEDNATPSHANTAGAGRIDLSKATKAGLLFDETYANFVAADPATGGKAETLNIASLYHHDCTDKCVFKRTVRSSGKAGTWTLAVTGLPAGSWSLDKTSFPLGATGKTSFSLTVDTAALTQGQWYYGQLTATSSDASVPVARLPIAVRPSTAKLAADSTAVQATARAGESTTKVVTVSNPGNPGLNWSVSETTLPGTIVKRPASSTGLPDRTIAAGSAITSANASNSYGADYFDVHAAGSRIKRLQMTGFTQSTGTLQTFATQFAWRVYNDVADLPEGIPGNAVAPVFAYQSAPTAAGTSFGENPRESGTSVSLDLAAAGVASPALAAGRYWLSMAPTVPAATTANSWYWMLSEVPGKAPAGQYAIPNSTTPANRSWRATTLPAVGDPEYTGLAMVVDIDAACGAPWMQYSATSGSLGRGASAPVTVTFNAASLAPGTYKTYLCLSGNGTSPASIVTDDTDTKLIPVTFTVTAPASTAIAASNGTAAPASAPVTTQTVLTVTVAPGANPASSGVGVKADLTSIGGSATQAFADDGQNGDVVQGDNVYSYTATVAANAAPGTKSFAVTVTDAQSRTANTTIALDVPAPTGMTAAVTATPSLVAPGGTTRIAATVTPGTLPAGSGIAVTANLAAIGGSANAPLYDDGTHGDVQQGDGVYTADVTVDAGTSNGVKLVDVTATDAIGRTAAATAGLNVATPGALSGSAVAAPGSVLPGAPTLFIVAVVPGTNPASTNVTVTADLTAIGGAASQAFYDDGTHGDSTSGDGVYSFGTTVGAGATLGAHLTLPVSIADQQGRTATTSIPLDIASDRIFGDSFDPQ